MSYYFWLGAEADLLADEQAQYTITDNPDGGFTATLIEDDGDITLYPTLPQS